MKGNQIVLFAVAVDKALLQLTSAHTSIVRTTSWLCFEYDFAFHKKMCYFYCRASSPPTFTVIPSDVKINDGQTIVLKACVDGNYDGIYGTILIYRL